MGERGWKAKWLKFENLYFGWTSDVGEKKDNNFKRKGIWKAPRQGGTEKYQVNQMEMGY